MPRFELAQAGMMQTLDHGPDFLPDLVFAGSRARILLGLKVHANTISHARLVALEETFPRTLAALGHDRFNAHSRSYIKRPGVTARPLARIGEDFPAHLANLGEHEAADLARFEWRWLEAYHAAEAVPLRLADLAGISPEALMEIAVEAHPSASIGQFGASVNREIGKEVPGLGRDDAILLGRPDAEVLVSAASPAMVAILARAGRSVSIGNHLAGLCEPGKADSLSPDHFMQALIALLDAGALIKGGQQRVD